MLEEMRFPLLMDDAATLERPDAGAALGVMGDEEFRAFYDRTARPLWSYLSRITG